MSEEKTIVKFIEMLSRYIPVKVMLRLVRGMMRKILKKQRKCIKC